MSHAKGTDRQKLLACLPFSEPQEIRGLWLYGFEQNVFLEGLTVSTLDERKPPRTYAQLQSYDPHLPLDGRSSMLQMKLIGRRSLCPIFPGEWIVVDRVLSKSIEKVVPPIP
jgi:hypothetical protein